MTDYEQILSITNMNAKQFKAFSKALRILMHSGIDQITATHILCEARKGKY